MSDNIKLHLPRKLPAGITEERAKELTIWVYKIWDMHWKAFAPTSNSRADFQKYVLRDYKILTPDLLTAIELAVKAYTKHLNVLSRNNHKLVGIKTLSVWYNQECYNDQFIEDTSRQASGPGDLAECCIEGCKHKVHGKAYQHCTDHIPNTNIETLRDGYRQMVDDGVIQKGQSLSEQCRAILAAKIDNVNKDLKDAIEMPKQRTREEQVAAAGLACDV
jgi:hypothetical protein